MGGLKRKAAGFGPFSGDSEAAAAHHLFISFLFPSPVPRPLPPATPCAARTWRGSSSTS